MSRRRVVSAVFAAALPFLPIIVQAADDTGRPRNYMTKDHLVLGSQLVGRAVYNDRQQELGTIVDVLIDPAGGTPSVLLDVGKFLDVGEKTVLVTIDRVHLDGGKMLLPGATHESLAGMTMYHLEPLYTN